MSRFKTVVLALICSARSAERLTSHAKGHENLLARIGMNDRLGEKIRNHSSHGIETNLDDLLCFPEVFVRHCRWESFRLVLL